jgi:hypothetical protein
LQELASGSTWPQTSATSSKARSRLPVSPVLIHGSERTYRRQQVVRVERLAKVLPAAELSNQLGSEDIEGPDLVVDVLYAHDVKAGVVSVRELHADDVKIGEKGDSED